MRTIAIALGLILAALYLWAVAILSTSQPVDLVWTVAPAKTAQSQSIGETNNGN